MPPVRWIELRQIMQDIVNKAKLGDADAELLRRELYRDGKIDRESADFLIELYKQVPHVSPGFEKFLFQALKDYMLANGKIDAKKTAWLREFVQYRGPVTERERRFLHELKGQAKEVSPEFEKLLAESERHLRQGTSG